MASEIRNMENIVTPSENYHHFAPMNKDSINRSINQEINKTGHFLNGDFSLVTLNDHVCVTFSKLAYDSSSPNIENWDFVFALEIMNTKTHRTQYKIIKGEKKLRALITKLEKS